MLCLGDVLGIVVKVTPPILDMFTIKKYYTLAQSIPKTTNLSQSIPNQSIPKTFNLSLKMKALSVGPSSVPLRAAGDAVSKRRPRNRCEGDLVKN